MHKNMLFWLKNTDVLVYIPHFGKVLYDIKLKLQQGGANGKDFVVSKWLIPFQEISLELYNLG